MAGKRQAATRTSGPAGRGAGSPSPPTSPAAEGDAVTKAAAFNRALGLKINREIWNGRQFDKIPTYFAEDFVSDYSPNVVRHGRHHIQEAVEGAHTTFEGFRP